MSHKAYLPPPTALVKHDLTGSAALSLTTSQRNGTPHLHDASTLQFS